MNLHAPQAFEIEREIFGAERAILARCLTEPALIAQAGARLSPAEFQHPFLGECFRILLDLHEEEKNETATMLLLEAVGRGSRNEPRFIHLTYKPEKARKGRSRVCLVGKGLTFDSGGLCIKPAPGMGDMKSDMAGAALAIGAMAAIGALKPDVEVHCLVAAAENMPDGDAYRPGDVFGSLVLLRRLNQRYSLGVKRGQL